jgi:beta-N-acetylhexosaminidase
MIGAFIAGCAGPVLLPQEAAFFAAAKPWGLIVFKRNCETPEQLRALTFAFRQAVGRRDAPVFVDQEGGRVQRLGPPSNHWRTYPPARAFDRLYTQDPLAALRAARNVARLMARDLREAGITADCLPVLDLPQPNAHDIIGDRAYSLQLERIILLARAHVAGLLDGGVLPVMKHIPGHGRARVDSHQALPVVEAPLSVLRASDFQPFAALADLPMAMTAHVVFTAIDTASPATLSRKVIGKAIRKEIGFDGLLMTDDLSMKALSGSFTEKVTAALAAGCDIVLHCNGKLDEMQEEAAAAGPLRGKALRRARAALRWLRRPQRFDEKAAIRDLGLLA